MTTEAKYVRWDGTRVHTAAEMDPRVPLKATVIDDDKFALLAMPFSGPIPSPKAPRGVDLDGEWFSERTDIKADWLPFRVVDWHHGADSHMRRETFGKADNLRMEEDGWWVDIWIEHGKKRLELIRKLAERGAQLFGSSESVKGMVKVDRRTGHIDVWPYFRQTLSTSPQNTHSVLRPLKAVLQGTEPTDAFWSDIEAAMRDLGADLHLTSRSEGAAKSGRVLSAVNMKDIEEALASFDAAAEKVRAVLARQPEYNAGSAGGAENDE